MFYKIFVSPMLHKKRTAAAVLFLWSTLPPTPHRCAAAPEGATPPRSPWKGDESAKGLRMQPGENSKIILNFARFRNSGQ